MTATSYAPVLMTSILISTLALGSASGCDCHGGGDAARRPGAGRPVGDLQGEVRRDASADRRGAKSTLIPERREPGPRRPETAAEIAAEGRRAHAFTAALKKSLNRREVTALADIRGYRLYKRRYFGRAHAWFLAAVATDPRFELSLYNAARTASLLGHPAEARAFLARLRRLETPLARQRLRMARTDPDLARARAPSSRSSTTSRPTKRIEPASGTP